MSLPPRTRFAAVQALAVLAAGGLLARKAEARTGKLLVFLHVALKQRAFESELQAALPNLEVRAVGRLGDFERGLEEGQDAVLSLPALLTSHGLVGKLQGMRGGSPEEKYSLVGAGAQPDPARVAAVGALDLLGRDGTNAFVYTLLGSKPKVERVTKFEDLLPLIQMQKVDAILLPTRLLPDVQAASRLSLTQRELTNLVKLPAVASVGAGGAEVLAAIAHLPAKVSRTLGVDEWR
ncbi:MAG TPA: hypothetical protein VGQ57_21595 [Polyangiaceae bacterium]|jgi:hypothetical protein|nr:hypothetical protein [Polyangiaceae bacterium]